MQFLKTVFWVLIGIIVVLFSVRNWFAVTVNLWGDIQADTKLPVLLLIGFLIYFGYGKRHSVLNQRAVNPTPIKQAK